MKDAVKIPFFIKLTPNITEITDIARAAKEGKIIVVFYYSALYVVTCWNVLSREKPTQETVLEIEKIVSASYSCHSVNVNVLYFSNFVL